MSIVISLGGSLINPGGKPDIDYVRKIAEIIKKSNEQIGVVTGGGKIAREYINAVSILGGTPFDGDEIAINETRQNAKLVLLALGKEAYPNVMESFNEARAAEPYKYVVMGGVIPGITTDTVSVLLAEAIGADRVINISNVDGIYSDDPSKNPNAKKYDEMSHDQLVELAIEQDKRGAGENFVFDVLACKLARRSKIELHFISGKRLEDVENSILRRPHRGTVVKP